MTFHHPNSSLLQFHVLKPLVLFAIISYFSFDACASALPQTAAGPLQKSLELSRLNFYYIDEQPNYTQINLRMTVAEDSTWYDNVLFTGDLERMRQDPDTIVSNLINQYDYLSERAGPSQEVGPPFRFSLHLADPLPNYVTDEPVPDPPYLEDYMWLLDTSLSEGARQSRMNELYWRPWYETFYMDGPFRMQVFYIGTDYKLYSGLVDVPAEAIGPYPGGVKVGELRAQYQPMRFTLDFVRDLDDELEIDD